MQRIALTAALFSARVFADQEELGPVLKQIYKKDEGLDLILDEAFKYKSRLEFDKGFQAEQPVIGIATTPVFSETMKTDTFGYDHFTW